MRCGLVFRPPLLLQRRLETEPSLRVEELQCTPVCMSASREFTFKAWLKGGLWLTVPTGFVSPRPAREFGGGLLLFSSYFHTNLDIVREANWAILMRIAEVIRTVGTPFIIGAD